MAMKGRQKHADRLKIPLRAGQVYQGGGPGAFTGADMIRAEAPLDQRGSVLRQARSSSPGEPPNRDTGALQPTFAPHWSHRPGAQVTSEAPWPARRSSGTLRMEARAISPTKP